MEVSSIVINKTRRVGEGEGGGAFYTWKKRNISAEGSGKIIVLWPRAGNRGGHRVLSSSRESSPHRLLFIVRGDRGNARVSNACSTCPSPPLPTPSLLLLLLLSIPRQRLVPLARFESRFKSERNKQSPFFFPSIQKWKGKKEISSTKRERRILSWTNPPWIGWYHKIPFMKLKIF